MWFQPTGWRPADVEAELPKKAVNLAEFEKLDPKIRGARRDYVLGQFFVLIGLALFAADVFARNGAQAVLLPCFLLWPHLYTLGPPNKSLPYAGQGSLAYRSKLRVEHAIVRRFNSCDACDRHEALYDRHAFRGPPRVLRHSSLPYGLCAPRLWHAVCRVRLNVLLQTSNPSVLA